MKLKDKLPSMSEEEQLRLLATNGMLIKRPLIVGDNTVLVGFKEAEWIEKLKYKRGTTMKLKNVLIVVKDIEKSKQFYHDVFGLDVVLDNDGNMILTEGLVLQDEKIWKEFLQKDIVPQNNSCELYFEEPNVEAFAQRLEELYPSIQYVNRLMTHSWGQKVIRFYDLDGNLIEVGTPM
jgi:catechol 2,3-dioxygenase-like lactoylglutathione lyase family enzyme